MTGAESMAVFQGTPLTFADCPLQTGVMITLVASTTIRGTLELTRLTIGLWHWVLSRRDKLQR